MKAKPKKKKAPAFRRRSPEQAREEILSAAERLITELGPDAVSLPKVAREVGVSHALITHYFGTYEQLVEAVLHNRMRALAEEVLRRAFAAGVPERPAALLDLAWDMFEAGPVRLFTWALLSKRLRPTDPDSFPSRTKGLRRLADTFQARRAEALAESGLPALSQERTDFVILAGLSAIYGYAIGREFFLAGLDKPITPESDVWFRRELTDTLRELLGLPRQGKPDVAPPS
jgi:TetR/AcrR family transcriptional regulator, repressor for neighboring sulfatase